MDVLTEVEIKEIVRNSRFAAKYNEEIDRESAYEILTKKVEKAKSDEHLATLDRQIIEEKKVSRRSTNRKETSFIEELSKNTMMRQVGRTVARELTRGILGILGVKTRSR